MTPKKIAYILIALGVIGLVQYWGTIADALSTDADADREKKIVIWSNSGSPDVERREAREWEKERPDVYIQFYFRQSGRLQDTIYVSFLSGSPPDMMTVTFGDLRDMVAAGMLRPMDDLLERSVREYEKRGDNFFDFIMGGENSIFRFQTNPNDPLLKRDKDGEFIYPLEAARLLHMHGKFLGFTGSGVGTQTLTYNRRIFRNAGLWYREQEGDAKGLIDENDEPIPPRTWMELIRKARLITEYGKESGEGCHGIVVQGRTAKDLMRGIEPLAAVAGSRGFDYNGSDWLGDGKPMGRYDYDNPAFLAAFNLLLRLKAEGSVLPGTGSREFEDSRTRLAEGKAAMLIDGWHAALIGVERVPWAKNDIGSAPIPVPYEVERTAEGEVKFDADGDYIPNREQKKQIEQLLGVSDIGRGVGYKSDRENTTCITSGSQWPWEAWSWMQRNPTDEDKQKVGPNRGTLPGNMLIARHIDDPEWFPFPFQKQAWEIWLNKYRAWPQPPASVPVLAQNYKDVLHDLFHSRDPKPGDEAALGSINKELRERLGAYNDAVNGELAKRIKTGEASPEQWTFPEFNPLRPAPWAQKQARESRVNDALNRKIDELKRFLPTSLQFETQDEQIAFFSGFETSASPFTVLLGPGLLLLIVVIYIAYLRLRPRKPFEPTWLELKKQARGNWYAYLFVLPAMLMLFSFIMYGAIYQFYLSFHKGSGIAPLQFVGIDQYADIFRDTKFWTRVLPNTAQVMIIVPICHITIGLVIASLLTMPTAVNRFVRPLFFIPLAVSMAAVSVVFLGLLGGPDSGINEALEMLGLDRLPYWLGLDPQAGRQDWLGSPMTDLYSVILVAVWHGLPYNIILLLAGLQSIDPQLYEAGKVDGAGPLQRFFHITVPELTPILIVIGFNALIGAARMFGPVWILTEGGKSESSEVVATYIFKWGFTKPPDQWPDVGYASALGMMYSLILGLLVFTNVTIIIRRWKRRLAMERAAAQQPSPAGGKV